MDKFTRRFFEQIFSVLVSVCWWGKGAAHGQCITEVSGIAESASLGQVGRVLATDVNIVQLWSLSGLQKLYWQIT